MTLFLSCSSKRTSGRSLSCRKCSYRVTGRKENINNKGTVDLTEILSICVFRSGVEFKYELTVAA